MSRVGLEEVSISGVMLRREGDYAVVEVERKLADGTFKWYEIMREFQDSNYSHIVEPSKIQGLFWERQDAAEIEEERGRFNEWFNASPYTRHDVSTCECMWQAWLARSRS